jgi:hypothetical protein
MMDCLATSSYSSWFSAPTLLAAIAIVPALIMLDRTITTSKSDVASTVPAVGTVPRYEMNLRSTMPNKVFKVITIITGYDSFQISLLMLTKPHPYINYFQYKIIIY